MLGRKLHSGTFKTKQLVPVHLDLPLFWPCNLRHSMRDFIPCDRIVQRACYLFRRPLLPSDFLKWIVTSNFCDMRNLMPVVFGLIHVKMSFWVTRKGQLWFSERQWELRFSEMEWKALRTCMEKTQVLRKSLRIWRKLKSPDCKSNQVIIVAGIILSV